MTKKITKKSAPKVHHKDGYVLTHKNGEYKLTVYRRGRVTYQSTEGYKNRHDLFTALSHDVVVLTQAIVDYVAKHMKSK